MNKKFLIIKIPLLALCFFCFVLTAEQKSQDSGLDAITKSASANQEETGQKNQPLSDSTEVQKETGRSHNPLDQVETAGKIQEQTESNKETDRNISEIDSSDNQRFLEFGLEYPMNFGAHLRYLLSDSFYVRFGFGLMPELFLSSFKELSPSFGYLNEEEAILISDTFEDSLYLDLRLAWLPYLKESGGGPYLELGLSGIFYGSGELDGLTLRKAIPSIDSDDEFDESKNYSVKTNAYNATVHIGYQIPLEKMKLNIEVGVIKILSTNILNVDTLIAPELLSAKQKENFKNFLQKKGWIFPTISGWISFSF